MPMPVPKLLLFLFICSLWACSPTLSPIQKLHNDIKSKTDNTPGTYAIAFADLQDTSKTILINEKVVFHAASTMKTPVMIELFKQSKAGKFSFNDSLLVKNEFRSIVDGSAYSMDLSEDSDELLYKRIGSNESIYDLMYNMIINSSNLATNILIETVGAKNVTQTLRGMSAHDIKVLRGVEDIKAYRQGLSNTTNALDLMIIFQQIGNKTAVDKRSSEEMINILLDQKHKDLIPALLPESVKVAHKTGFITKVLHDSGIVMLPDGRQYVLIILSKEWKTVEEAEKIIASISRLIYDFYQDN